MPGLGRMQRWRRQDDRVRDTGLRGDSSRPDFSVQAVSRARRGEEPGSTYPIQRRRLIN